MESTKPTRTNKFIKDTRYKIDTKKKKNQLSFYIVAIRKQRKLRKKSIQNSVKKNTMHRNKSNKPSTKSVYWKLLNIAEGKIRKI